MKLPTVAIVVAADAALAGRAAKAGRVRPEDPAPMEAGAGADPVPVDPAPGVTGGIQTAARGVRNGRRRSRCPS